MQIKSQDIKTPKGIKAIGGRAGYYIAAFSTERAGTGHSLQSRIVSGATPKQTLRSPSQRLNLPREDQFGVPVYAPIVAQYTTQQP